MKIITKTAAENSAYPPLQDWPNLVQPDGYYKWPDSLETETFYQYNGFVVLTIQRVMVTAYEPNIDAWEAWKASLPPDPGPEPSGDYVTYGELAAAIREGVNAV